MKRLAATLSRTTIIASSTLMIVLTTGCSTLNGGSSFAYGKLTAMQSALNDAAQHCQNTDAMNRASNWAAIGSEDLQQSTAYMDRNSKEYTQARELMAQLSTLNRRSRQTDGMCDKIRTAAAATQQYLIAQTIVVASR